MMVYEELLVSNAADLEMAALEMMGLKVDPINVRLEPAFPDGITGEVESLGLSA